MSVKVNIKEISWKLTSVEEAIFSIVCIPKRFSLIERPLRSGSGLDVGVVGVRHGCWEDFGLMLDLVTVGVVVIISVIVVAVALKSLWKMWMKLYISFSLCQWISMFLLVIEPMTRTKALAHHSIANKMKLKPRACSEYFDPKSAVHQHVDVVVV